MGERVWNGGRGRAQMGIWREEKRGLGWGALSQRLKQGAASRLGQGSPGEAAGLRKGSRRVGCYRRQGWGPSWQPGRKCLGAPRLGCSWRAACVLGGPRGNVSPRGEGSTCPPEERGG